MIKIAAFQTDATPPLGSPLCLGLVKPTKKIIAPLSARGIVILGAEKPIVLCAVDWLGIGGEAYDFWRQTLAKAAGTTVERVTAHTHHPHDAPGHIFSGKEFSDLNDMAGMIQDTSFAENTARKVAKALRSSLSKVKPVTHYGYGRAKIARVASNRRIIGKDGRIAHWRGSGCKDKAIRDMPEGIIDPWLQNLSFWNGEEPVASLTYYATHPQSFYGAGAVSPDFVGLARSIREATLSEVAHLHFNGCSGNIAAGKYNDCSPQNRLILAQRLLKGMENAWEQTRKYALNQSDIQWQFKSLSLPVRDYIVETTEKQFLKTINDKKENNSNRILATLALSWRRRRQAGSLTDISCLRIGQTAILHLPGEMFIEYQLAAQKMRAPGPVLTASYGDYSPFYIGPKKSYREGGYETSKVSFVAPESEEIILEAMRELLVD